MPQKRRYRDFQLPTEAPIDPALDTPKLRSQAAKARGVSQGHDLFESIMGDETGVAGMIGGLPSGLNPSAIRELLKRMGLEAAEEGGQAALGPTSRALKDVVERRVQNTGAPAGVSERRFEELMKKFGGTKVSGF